MMLEDTHFGQNADAILSHWDAGEEFYSRNSTFDFVILRNSYDGAWRKYAANHTLPSVMDFSK